MWGWMSTAQHAVSGTLSGTPAKQSPRVPGIKPHKGDTQILYENGNY